MKIIWVILIALCLAGCSEPVYETVADAPAVETAASCQQIVLSLPEEASASVSGRDGLETIYECDGYTITVQTLEAGDLNRSFKTLTGYNKDALQVIRSVKGVCDRYDAVFTAAGEASLQVGRICILDDGSYHYAVTTLAPEERAGQLRPAWDDLYSSFRLVDADADLSTGS